MRSRQIHEQSGQNTFALIFETGDEVISSLSDFARREKITAASFQAIGAFREVTIGYFD